MEREAGITLTDDFQPSSDRRCTAQHADESGAAAHVPPSPTDYFDAAVVLDVHSSPSVNFDFGTDWLMDEPTCKSSLKGR